RARPDEKHLRKDAAVVGEPSSRDTELSPRETFTEGDERKERSERGAAKVEGIVRNREGKRSRGEGRRERGAETNEPTEKARGAECSGELFELERNAVEPFAFVEETRQRASRHARRPRRNG